jgi:hypothetical protein
MIFKVAYRNVVTHWKQSLAAFLSISAAFFCYVLFQGYMMDVRNQYLDGYRNRSMYGDLFIRNKDIESTEAKKDVWKYSLSQDDQVLIDKVLQNKSEQISTQVRFLNFQGLITTGVSSKIFLGQGYDAQAGAKSDVTARA